MQRKIASICCSALFFIVFSPSTLANTLKPNAPQSYVVQAEDSLWEIADQFFTQPWQWQSIWKNLDENGNPPTIRPGDVISINETTGHALLAINEDIEQQLPTVKLSPHVRVSPLDSIIPTIPMDAIEQFLVPTFVEEEQTLDSAPYIAALSEDRVIAGTGDVIYVRELKTLQNEGYGIYRKGEAYVDPATEEVLGYEVIHLGEAKLQKDGDPATLVVTKSRNEILVKDRILPIQNHRLPNAFTPREPPQDMYAHIISVYSGVSQIGQYDIVIINRGLEHGIESGHVLGVYRHGGQALDPTIESMWDSEKAYSLPDERAGLMMVLKPFSKVSTAIILKATKALHLGDVAAHPYNVDN